MWERVNKGSVGGKDGVEQVCQADAVCFRGQSQQAAIRREPPLLARGEYLQVCLAIAVDEFAAETARGILVGELHYGGAMPLDVNDGHWAVG